MEGRSNTENYLELYRSDLKVLYVLTIQLIKKEVTLLKVTVVLYSNASGQVKLVDTDAVQESTV